MFKFYWGEIVSLVSIRLFKTVVLELKLFPILGFNVRCNEYTLMSFLSVSWID